MFVAVAASCPLLASCWESEVAVASALRWFSAALLLAGSAPVWGRAWIARQAGRLGWRPARTDWNLASHVRSLVFLLGLFPPVAMALGIGLGALARSSRHGEPWADSGPLWALAGVSIVIAGALRALAGRRIERDKSGLRPTWPWAAAALLLVLGTAPILSLVLYQVGIALKHSPILGPDPDSLFARMGLAGSYAAPILMTALVLVGYAIRERSSGFGLAGGLVLNAGATAAYLLLISKGGLRFDAAQWIRLAQLNAAVAACNRFPAPDSTSAGSGPDGPGARLGLVQPGLGTSGESAAARCHELGTGRYPGLGQLSLGMRQRLGRRVGDLPASELVGHQRVFSRPGDSCGRDGFALVGCRRLGCVQHAAGRSRPDRRRFAGRRVARQALRVQA